MERKSYRPFSIAYSFNKHLVANSRRALPVSEGVFSRQLKKEWAEKRSNGPKRQLEKNILTFGSRMLLR